MTRQKDRLDPVARLRDQIPEAGFPRGVKVASATGFVLLLMITAFTALYLSTAGPFSALGAKAADVVPDEVVESRRRATAALAQALATSATTAAGDLQVATGSGVFDNADDDAVLDRLGETYPDWRGIVVFDPAARKVLATHGEPVAVENLQGATVQKLTVRPIARPGGTPLVITALPLSGARAGRLLVVSTVLRGAAPELDKDIKEQLRLVTPDGTLLHSHGTEAPKDDRTAQDLLARAGAAAAAGESGVFTGDSGTDPVKPDRRVAPVVAFAPVASDGVEGSLGLAAVTLSRFPVEPVPARWPGLIPAAALLVIAIAGFVLLRRALVDPILRLRADALAVAAGVLDRPVRQSRIREVNRLTRAVERYRAKLGRRRPRAKLKPFLSAQLVIALVSLMLLGWSVAVAATLGRQHAAVSPSMLSEYGDRVAHTADTLRRSLSQGLGDLRAVARLSADKKPDQLHGMLDRLATSESRFRSVYLADAEGGELQRAGRESLRDPGKLPDGAGLRQHNTSGRVPVVYAFAHVPNSANVLVGEFDVPRMASVLESAGGRVRVVDEGKRTIADTEGYFAFSELTDPVLVKNITTARSGEDARETTATTLVAAERLADDGNAAALNWVVVAEQPIGSLGVADNTVRAGARVAALLTAVVALMSYAWHLLVVVLPLRRIAESAVPIAKGVGLGAVVYPQRQDEIGTIASCVEICRQALTDGKARLGEVRRPAGAATDETKLLRRVKDLPEEPSEAVKPPGAVRRPETRLPPRRPVRRHEPQKPPRRLVEQGRNPK
ncbi:hypothetical protein ACFORH_30515 [Amycolatopsis roodepoortensis]|uniref:Methyl-accepting chemotaxis protein n=1 Tax=Amycolatopsis roodepoortensis TaxID=700274 RepID=A0ABR9KY33_9PSEU|nr:hypothetical protein [Amycolatopsis roodepoortensis]MBE1573030.1 methyl-accepting chemotaxis protein [Amycolatopsis roodepoortensis]